MGARPEDYELLLPPGSYIHVDDFRSPKDLAEYLHIVDKNDTLYNSYFRWKDSYTAIHEKLVSLVSILTDACSLDIIIYYLNK